MSKNETETFQFSDCEFAFANSAYLSELWAVRDLASFKRGHPDLWSETREGHLRDEVKHAVQFLDFMRQARHPVVLDIQYSMQERLFGPYIKLSKFNSIEESAAVHNLTERRATWIYKTYLRHGCNRDLRKIVEQVLADEKGHHPMEWLAKSAFDSGPVISNQLNSELNQIDRKIFRKNLPGRYGAVMLNSATFWSDYYLGARFERDFDKIQTASRFLGEL